MKVGQYLEVYKSEHDEHGEVIVLSSNNEVFYIDYDGIRPETTNIRVTKETAVKLAAALLKLAGENGGKKNERKEGKSSKKAS